MVIALASSNRDDQLPLYLTRFFGREQELAVIAHLLADSAERVITLVGPGGVGKTRLLVEAIRQHSALAGDVVYVDGARLDRAELLLPEIVDLLEIEFQDDRSSGELLSEALAGRTILLLLDNMEHLLGAARDLAALLRAVPGLRIVSTSRSPLHISGERILTVDPLATIASGAQAPEPSTAAVLFFDRAAHTGKTAQPSDSDRRTVEAICARLDGLPLAIELAAARMRVLSAPALLALLTNQLALLTNGPMDVTERHRTLRAAIAWSYELLDADEQRLLRELSVFPEFCSLESASAICTKGERDLIDLLDALIDHALVIRQDDDRFGQPQFRLLISIHDYALEQLHRSGEEPGVRARHARYFREQAEQRESALTGAGQAEALGWLAAEVTDLRQALDFLIECGDQDAALRMVAALSRFWLIRVRWNQAREYFEQVFAMGDPAPSIAFGAALRGAAIVAESQFDWERAMDANTRAIAIWEELDERVWAGRSRIDLGNLFATMGRFDDAREHFQLAAKTVDPATDLRTRLVALGSISIVDLRQGRLRQADRGFETLIPELRKLDDPWLLATCISNHGIVKERLNRFPEARVCFEESLAIRRELGDDYGVGASLINLAGVQEDHADEVALSKEALEISLRIGAEEMVAAARVNLGGDEFGKGNFAAAAEYYIAGLNGYFSLGDEIQVADVITMIIELIEASDAAMTVRLLGAVHAIHEAHKTVAAGPIADRGTRIEARLRGSMDPMAFEQAMAEGRELSLADARLDAIEAARAAGAIGPPAASTSKGKADRIGGLTPREQDVLRLIVAGKTDRQIAEELFISPKTANHHVTNILTKLECRNRAAAASMAFRLGIANE